MKELFTRGLIYYNANFADPEVIMIRECVMNGVGCVQVINDVVLMASNGTIDLHLKGSLISFIILSFKFCTNSFEFRSFIILSLYL